MPLVLDSLPVEQPAAVGSVAQSEPPPLLPLFPPLPLFPLLPPFPPLPSDPLAARSHCRCHSNRCRLRRRRLRARPVRQTACRSATTGRRSCCRPANSRSATGRCCPKTSTANRWPPRAARGPPDLAAVGHVGELLVRHVLQRPRHVVGEQHGRISHALVIPA